MKASMRQKRGVWNPEIIHGLACTEKSGQARVMVCVYYGAMYDTGVRVDGVE